MGGSVGRSVSAGAISNLVKDENIESNGPLVPEKVLKSVQVKYPLTINVLPNLFINTM
jgi:hypothetical protein